MNKIVQDVNRRNLFWVVLLIVAAALIFLAPKAAVNVDEQLHYPHAKKVVNWYFTLGKDKSCLDTPQTNLKYYGQSVDNFTALLNRVFNIENEFLTRHYTGAFFFWLLLLFSGIMAHKLTGSWVVSVITVASLVFMPRLSGQAFGNLKDIPFATGYVAGLIMIVQFLREFPRPKWKTSVLLGLTVAFTVSVRAGGFILFAYTGLGVILYFILKPSSLKQIFADRPLFTKLLMHGAVILVTGYFAGLLFWPYALQNVLINPVKSLGVMEHYKVNIHQIFNGEITWSTLLPWYYLPKWILISTPLFVLTGFLIFSVLFTIDVFREKIKVKRLIEPGFILFSVLFPVVYVIAIKSNLYSGVRQMLFVFPPAAILASAGVYRLISVLHRKNKLAGIAACAVSAVVLVMPVKHQIITFPADYIYFNLLFGGNKNAWGNYEYDYYFHALKQPAEDLTALAKDENITVAMNCNLYNYFENHSNISYVYTRFLERSSANWDYAVFGINYIHPHLLKNNLWQCAGTLKTYYHMGNPVAVLVKRTDKMDFLGISEIKNGNLQLGAGILKNAIKEDPENVWMYVNLAQAKLKLGDFEEFEYYLGKGKEIHPFYEPLFLLETEYLYNKGEFKRAHSALRQLLEINPRYLPARRFVDLLNENLIKD